MDDTRLIGIMYQLSEGVTRIATALEANEKRIAERTVEPDSLGALALWREDVALDKTLLGFSEWLAWHVKDDPSMAMDQTEAP